MSRILWVFPLLAALPTVGVAQEKPGPKETVVNFKVEPIPAPIPALKYLLLPELKEMNPGNPIQGYLKSFSEQRSFYYGKASVEERVKWLEMPLVELPLKEIRNYGGVGLRNADYAARLDKPDWQILLQAKRDGIGLMVPDIQQMRDLAAALKLRLRGEIAERRFDDAIVTAKTIFALSRHMGEHPTLIGQLIGVFIANIGLDPVEEMVQQPGCPNLYWALAAVPDPFIDFRRGLEGERLIVEAEFNGLDPAEPMSDAQLQKVVKRLAKTSGIIQVSTERKKEGPKFDIQSWLKARVADADHIRDSRQRLIAAGLAKDQVSQFPPLQVVLLDEKREFEVRSDEAMKWMHLPYWQAEAGLLAATKERPDDDALFGNSWTFGALKVRNAQVRLDRRFALLRHVEALRLHAAENGGKLPQNLEAVKVPLPPDPFTGKAFSYQLDGDAGVLRALPPAGQEGSESLNVKYLVTIKK